MVLGILLWLCCFTRYIGGGGYGEDGEGGMFFVGGR